MATGIQSINFTDSSMHLTQNACNASDAPLKDRVCCDWKKIYLIASTCLIVVGVALAIFYSLPYLALTVAGLGVICMITYDCATKNEGELPLLSQYRALEKANKEAEETITRKDEEFKIIQKDAELMDQILLNVGAKFFEFSNTYGLGLEENDQIIDQGFDLISQTMQEDHEEIKKLKLENSAQVETIQKLVIEKITKEDEAVTCLKVAEQQKTQAVQEAVTKVETDKAAEIEKLTQQLERLQQQFDRP